MKRIYNIFNTKEKRRELRKNMSEEELIFWSAVRDKKLGVKFRRQYGVGNYIADFYIAEYRIAIEIDGEQHLRSVGYDANRDRYFQMAGIQTLRFSTKELRENLPSVLKIILEKVKSTPNRFTLPSQNTEPPPL